MAKKPNAITHPDYDNSISEWEKWRICFEGGTTFVNTYLEYLSKRETYEDYVNRLKVTYSPSHAKAAIMRVQHAITERLIDIKRTGGPKSYQTAVKGEKGYVDHDGNSMSSFLCRVILPELLPLGKVGVFIDRSELFENTSKGDAAGKSPYLYHYKAENIRSWSYDAEGKLTSLLLRELVDDIDLETGLIDGIITIFRLVRLQNGVVTVDFFDEDGDPFGEQRILQLPEIPFVNLNLSSALMSDISDHQIALLNLASADMSFCVKANFPFYVEQRSLQELGNFIQSNPSPHASADDDYKPGTEDAANLTKSRETTVGTHHGRAYGPNLDPPSFIHPSPEPLRASMEKQRDIVKEIWLMLNLTVQNLEPRRASAESKQEDETSMNSGLSYIGMELEHAEREIARIWALYEGNKDDTVIKYPLRYNLRTDSERYAEADELNKRLPTLPSIRFQRETAKQIVEILYAAKLSDETIQEINDEIDNAEIIAIDPEVIQKDVEAEILSHETASRARLYPPGEVEKAKAEHAERAAAIIEAQTQRNPRGVDDLDSNATETNREEKIQAKDTTLIDSTKSRERGKAK